MLTVLFLVASIHVYNMYVFTQKKLKTAHQKLMWSGRHMCYSEPLKWLHFIDIMTLIFYLESQFLYF